MTTRIVFDPRLWEEAGYDQPDGNAQFWKEAEILRVYRHDGEEVADVRFLHNGRVSRGHFTSGMDHHAGFLASLALDETQGPSPEEDVS